MTIKEAREKNFTICRPNGTPLTERETEFIALLEEVEKKCGYGVLLAFLTIMEASIK